MSTSSSVITWPWNTIAHRAVERFLRPRDPGTELKQQKYNFTERTALARFVGMCAN